MTRMLTAKQKAPPSHVKLEEVEEWVKADKWRTTEVWQGVRLLEQMEDSDGNGGGISSSVNSAAAPCYRVNMALNGTASDAYVTIMNMPPLSRSGIIRTMRIVEAVDNNTDVIYLQLQPTYIYPTWTCKSRHSSSSLSPSHRSHVFVLFVLIMLMDVMQFRETFV